MWFSPMKTYPSLKLFKLTLARYLAAGILLLGTAQFAYSQNLITNGDFETGNFIGWTTTDAASGSALVVQFNAVAPDFTFAALFGATGADLDAISQTFATTPGATYSLSFFYQAANLGQTPNNEFNVLWNGTSVGSPFPNLNATDGFGTFTFQETATGTSTTLEFEGRNKSYFDILDNVSVTAVPDTGSTLGLVSLALAALFGASRLRSIRAA